MLTPTTAFQLGKAMRRIPDDVLPDMSADLTELRNDVERVLEGARGSDEIQEQIGRARRSLDQLEHALAELRRVISETADCHRDEMN